MTKFRKERIHWSEATPVVSEAAMSTAPPNYVIPRSWFSEAIVDFDLWLVCDGRVELENEKGEITVLTRGSVVLFGPGNHFELRVASSGPYTNAFVHFDLVDHNGKVIPHDQVDIPATTGYVQDIHCFEAILRRIMFLQYQHKQADPKTGASIQVLVSHLLKGLLYDYQLAQQFTSVAGNVGLDKHHSQMVSAALSWIYLHPDSVLSAAELAKKFGYSQRHFGRIFRQVSGKTPGQVLIEAKIDHAKKLLASSSLNVTEIAANLRYENVFYFSRQFSSVVGMSPIEFRRHL